MARRSDSVRERVAIGPDARVSDVVADWPEALDALLDMGFAPLRNPIARRTLGRLFTLRQAATFRGVELDDLLRTLRVATGQAEPEPEAPIARAVPGPADPGAARPTPERVAAEAPYRVPELVGDVRVLGLVPCPVRGPLVERFDAFASGLASETGCQIAWWLGGEGTASPDVRLWLEDIEASGDSSRLPDVLIAVGTELILHQRYGRLAARGVYGPFPGERQPRPELAALEDPRGVFALQFAVLFDLVCRPDRLPGGRLPRSWADLADPALKGEVGLPSLTLPIVPDLLAALHALLGEDVFAALADNIGATMHPAQAAPRTRRQDVPGIVVLPRLFTSSSAVVGGEVVVPEEGAVAVPAYVAVRDGARPEAARIASFLCSEAYLRPLWEHGKFLPNHRAVEAPIPKNRIVAWSWDSYVEGDAEAHARRLVALAGNGSIT